MDTTQTENTSLIPSPQSRMLTKQARRELNQFADTKVRCPECGGKPEKMITPGGTRLIITCPCGYLYDCDIY